MPTLSERLRGFAGIIGESFENKKWSRAFAGGVIPDWDCEAITTRVAEQDGLVELLTEAAAELDRLAALAVPPVPSAQEREDLLAYACDMKVHASDERTPLEVLRWRVLQMTDMQIRLLNPAWAAANPLPSPPQEPHV